MPALAIAKPEEIGFDPARLQRLYDLLQRWVDKDRVPAAAICVGRKGRMLEPRSFGRQRPEPKGPPLRNDARFYAASLTKPVTVAAVLMLLERGELSLEDRVADFVPRFAAFGKQDVRIIHLMTHTSGLPDMLPDNEELRKAHQPFSAFIDGTCKVSLAFAPGARVSYQSMGTAMLAEIVHQVTGTVVAEFLRKEMFEPLGLSDTALGLDAKHKERMVVHRLPPEHQNADWHWNSAYWLGFGCPWGGLITTPADYARICQLMLAGGTLDKVRILSRATVRAMASNQLMAMPQMPEEERRCRPWGLGWRLNWPDNLGSFGDLLGPRSFGHWGSTGNLCWMDPDAEAFCVLFTTQPLTEDRRFMARASNIVAAAWL
jgi:CubicO group peptidase (beta-lactamase class C family)